MNKGSEFFDVGIVYSPYIPITIQRTIMKREGIGFRSYEEFSKELYTGKLQHFRFDMLDKYMIVGLEMKNGEVMVYEDGKMTPGTIKNREAFNEKYFTESV